ncbi:methionyl-tRNA formyltransferase [Amnibacterium kyonggiense]|uniref:Methionyl-tRNA formyltransferase n=1 Tax=Amnibacterium kyonggiense TaxID=595671 RepID=A0A4R7FLY5_9MICO|nr:methionyl-tRNA formyltransferase [Amnibacterium kyonggiense]TDS77440.1 methionyl-tRNA formyltransferase [Amnibacterium kyonggiense]
MRIIFAGTPEAAVPSLEALAASAHEVVRVVTRPPAPLGRKRVLTPSPVEARAVELGLPVLRASRLREDETAELVALDADLAVVVAYGGLVREPLLSAPRLGWVNLHFSLLPRWRGAAPVQRAVIAGDRETGVEVFRLEAGLDTGPVLASETVAIGALETAGHLLARLAPIGARVLAGAVDRLADGTAVAVPQEGEPTLAPKLVLDDGRLDWTRPAERVFARLRGVTPEPGAWTTVGDRRLKVLEAAPARDAGAIAPGAVAADGRRVLVGCGDGALELLRVQPEGRAAMPADTWLRGAGAAVVLT